MNTAPKTISIRIRNSEKKLTKDHLIYEPTELNTDDPIIKTLLNDAVSEFGDDPEKISIICKLEVQ